MDAIFPGTKHIFRRNWNSQMTKIHLGQLMLHGEEGGFGICLEVPASTWLKGSQEISSCGSSWWELMLWTCILPKPLSVRKQEEGCNVLTKRKNNSNYFALRWATWAKGEKPNGLTAASDSTAFQGFVFFFFFPQTHFHSFLEAQNERNKRMSSNNTAHKLETDYAS